MKYEHFARSAGKIERNESRVFEVVLSGSESESLLESHRVMS